jgi:hypothetical protein
MDRETNKQEPSSKEGREMKIGDKVWVQCEVVEIHENLIKVTGSSKDNWFWAGREQCRPVEPTNCPEIPDSSSEPLQVGDAVRFVWPGHNRHGREGVLKSIHRGPKNAYLFVSDCGQFHRYCTIAELEHYDQAETVDVKGSMQSLDGADTIQAGDLQWTDRDSKYRLCNFTIGMRVHDAIQRGKAHGEKWVFYRKFKEAGEASGVNDKPAAVKRYRTPTLADLANGPIACEFRDSDEEHWRRGYLVHILNGDIPFLCVNGEQEMSGQWDQCRIEVGE